MNDRDRVATVLLPLRLGVFLVMLMWTLDKFINADHAARMFENFYSVGGLEQTAFLAIGVAELALILAFVAGYQKRVSYGLVLLLHSVSTLSSYRQYLVRSITCSSSRPGPCWRPVSPCITYVTWIRSGRSEAARRIAERGDLAALNGRRPRSVPHSVELIIRSMPSGGQGARRWAVWQ